MDAEKMMMQRRIDNLMEQLELVKRQRDAALYDLHDSRHCASCKHLEEKEELRKDYDLPAQCLNCISERSQHLWRGLCKENGGAEE